MALIFLTVFDWHEFTPFGYFVDDFTYGFSGKVGFVSPMALLYFSWTLNAIIRNISFLGFKGGEWLSFPMCSFFGEFT